MTTYEKVTLQAGCRERTIYLQNPRVSEVNQHLTGVQVDKEGDEIQPSKAYLKANNAEFGTKMHVIDLALVKSREPMVIDHKYGWLVPDGTATQQTGGV